ncbi:MAG: hypothetical protein RL341_2527 [Pseudomonadota bacterium]|jgi:putative proteasome-type protease
MTYCVAMRLNAGLVFLSDSRTNAGVDHVSTHRKMTVFERGNERLIVLMTAGNLAISQAVRTKLSRIKRDDGMTIWTATNMFQVAQLLGDAIRSVHERDAGALEAFKVDFNASFILGGQIRGEVPRLFQVYAAGNFIEAADECPYFQIGEAKYGKPIVDRIINPRTPLDEAAKCALISMDSTLRSNISVGLPLDLLVYEADRLAVTHFSRIDENNAYYRMIRSTWGARLKQVFNDIPDPSWVASDLEGLAVGQAQPPRVNAPDEDAPRAPAQTLAQQS